MPPAERGVVGIKPPSRTVFFGNLHPNIDDSVLLELCIQAGPVSSVRVQRGDAQRVGGRAMGFVTYTHLDSAMYCLGLYRGLLQLYGAHVNVNFANKVRHYCSVILTCRRANMQPASQPACLPAGPHKLGKRCFVTLLTLVPFLTLVLLPLSLRLPALC